ncbi:MAG: hypothetical protein ACI4HI_05715 [Lachnospiraceae bacterium]
MENTKKEMREKMQETKDILEQNIEIQGTHKVLRFLIRLVSVILATYIGGWLMLARPLIGIYDAISSGTLVWSFFVRSLVKILFSTTVIGAIWCGGYIAAGYFRVYKDE